MTVTPPRWTADQLETDRCTAINAFRNRRTAEPLEDYLEHFDEVRSAVENLLEMTVDLSRISQSAVEVLTDSNLLEAVRYLAGPPISMDDLKVAADAQLSPRALRKDPDMARRVIETILLGLDRNRFPWVAEDREPNEAERAAATMASAALIASRRVMTARANVSKVDQEQLVKDQLLADGFAEVPPRKILTLAHAPELGEFCGEALFGKRKADLVVRLWDRRVMPIECKVSNSSTNSVKRLNNDAEAKAGVWIREFGTAQTIPAAVLDGVFKRHNLEQAQDGGLTLFWSHDLAALATFIAATRLST